MVRPPPALLVVNRRASRAEEGLARIREACRALELEVDLRVPDDPESLPRLIAGSARAAGAVIVAGGDGTLHHALPAVREAEVPMGILPLGTANDAARSLGLPLEIEKALAVVARGRTRAVDLAYVGERPYLNVASFGLTGDVTRELDEETKKRWGVLSYPLGLMRALRRSRSFQLEATVDGRSHRFRALQVAVANGPSYGGGMRIDSEARLDDGLLTLCVIESASLWRLARLLPRLKLGRARGEPGAAVFRCERVEVRSSRRLEVSADGEIVASTPVGFRIAPRQLRVFAPEQEKR